MPDRINGLCRMNPGLAGEFKRTFGIPLKSFWDVYTGFDLVRFDEEFLKTPDGTSTEDYLRSQYSGSAVVLIKRLIQ